MMERYFNTSGPNILSQHYTLMREGLVAKGMKMVRGDRYFTIWAPRQTGKSTYFALLKTALKAVGYRAVHLNVENYLDATKEDLLKRLSGLIAEETGKPFDVRSFTTMESTVNAIRDIKLVLIIDEIEGLNPEIFGQFLHTLRNLYHSRTEHCLKSVILVGVSNIVGVVQDNASPFNISDNLNVPYFTVEEVYELLGQHETETGQLFAPEVKAKIADVTACQPGLVNGFGKELIERYPDKPVLGMAEYLEVEDWYLRKAIDKNLSNIINKAKQHRPFVERLLFSEEKVRFDIDRPAIQMLYVNGVIDEDADRNVVFRVPLYRKRLHSAFYPYLNGEQGRLTKEIHARDYFLPDGELDFPSIIALYKSYVQRRGFKYFREKDDDGKYLSLKEAALVYSFETFVAAFLDEAGGKSYLEPHVGLGRSDLVINVGQREYVVEFKVYSGESNFLKGKKQLAYYCKKLGLNCGEYLVFVPNHVKLPEVVNETPEIVEGTGVTVRPWLVVYDEEKDF